MKKKSGRLVSKQFRRIPKSVEFGSRLTAEDADSNNIIDMDEQE